MPDLSAPAAAELRGFIERIERLAEQKEAIGDDIAGEYREARVKGFDRKSAARSRQAASARCGCARGTRGTRLGLHASASRSSEPYTHRGARLMGDPAPGRSALARRAAATT